MSDVVLVVGDGRMADFVCCELSADCRVVRQTELPTEVPNDAAIALVLQNGCHFAVHARAEKVFKSAGTPWLRGFVSFGNGVIGPLVRPGTPGCSQCADLRRLMAGSDRRDMLQLHQELALNDELSPDPWASRNGLLQLAHHIVAETRRVLRGNPPKTDGHLFLVNLRTLKTTRHHFLPDPQCPVCGGLPNDSPTASRIVLESSPKIGIDSYRCRPMDELKGFLLNDYLDFRTGLLNGEMQDLVAPFAAMSVNLPLIEGDEGTAGRTLSYEESELTAILEGLERYCGLTPRGKRTVVHDSFRHLQEQALNPATVGIHAQEQYARRDFPFKPFDPDRPIDWVWGYSFLRERPILVPELLAYYSLVGGDGFVYETSNGCALGGNLVEAIFHGILEVVERDAFLLTWYAQLPLPRLDLDSANDEELRLMVARLQAVTGYDLLFYNATMENGIPSVWAIAKNRRQAGVNLICAAGAHLDPVRAVKGAIHELAGMLLTFDEKLEANRETYLRMYHDPFQVTHMEDHSMLYSLSEAEERLQFLLDDRRPLRTFDEEYMQTTRHADLTDDLKDVLQVFRHLKLDVIVVDQTTPELKRNGLYCVKVLIPGMLPITFGYHLTRLEGLNRVLRVPMELGYTRQPLTREQLNRHPHPFP